MSKDLSRWHLRLISLSSLRTLCFVHTFIQEILIGQCVTLYTENNGERTLFFRRPLGAHVIVEEDETHNYAGVHAQGARLAGKPAEGREPLRGPGSAGDEQTGGERGRPRCSGDIRP